MSAETVRHVSTYITLFLTLHNQFVMTINTTGFTHRPRVSLARFSFCWWRHNRLLMTSQLPDNCDAITWIVISNSLDIDYIHDDVHGRWCKNIKKNVPCASAKWYKLYNCETNIIWLKPDRTWTFLGLTIDYVHVHLAARHTFCCISFSQFPRITYDTDNIYIVFYRDVIWTNPMTDCCICTTTSI